MSDETTCYLCETAIQPGSVAQRWWIKADPDRTGEIACQSCAALKGPPPGVPIDKSGRGTGSWRDYIVPSGP